VDKDVENRGLTGRKASIGAASNKMPIQKAKNISIKINNLARRFVRWLT
jgi:hypothetical protein